MTSSLTPDKYEKSIDFIFETIEEFKQFQKEDIFEEIETDKVDVHFPFSESEVALQLSKEQIVNQIEEFQSFKLNEEKNRVETHSAIYYLIEGNNSKAEIFLEKQVMVESKYKNINIEIVYDKSLLMGLIALSTKSYHQEYYSPLNYSDAIKITPPIKREESKEKEAILSFQFELTSNHDILISETFFFDNVWDDDEQEENNDDFGFSKSEKIKLKPLLDYEDGLKMYLTANSIYDSEFRYLSLYKIVEHYSPIVLKTEAFEDLAKKLDSPKSLKPDSKYLNSILELATSLELRKKDKELIKIVLKKCIDITDIIELFPDFINTRLNGLDLSYDGRKQDKEKAINIISDILYSTRNQHAHAKANFQSNGEECPEEELDDLNNLLEIIVKRVIKWNSRLPEHLKHYS